MADKNGWPVLSFKSAFGDSYVTFQGYRRILNDADVVAVLFKDLVHALPARAVHKTAMNQNDVLHSRISFSCSIVWHVFANCRSLKLYSWGGVRELARQEDFTQESSSREEFVILRKQQIANVCSGLSANC